MSIWHGTPSLEALNALCADTLLERLDIRFTEFGDDFLCASMPVDRRTRQPQGLLHGGASVALAESLGSTAATLCIDAAEYQQVGLEINANHVRSARYLGGLIDSRSGHLHPLKYTEGLARAAESASSAW